LVVYYYSKQLNIQSLIHPPNFIPNQFFDFSVHLLFALKGLPKKETGKVNFYDEHLHLRKVTNLLVLFYPPPHFLLFSSTTHLITCAAAE